METVLITGGAGYVGSPLTSLLLDSGFRVVVFDKLCFGGESLVSVWGRENFAFIRGDICSKDSLEQVFGRHQAEWLPYWSNHSVASVQPAMCKVNLYNRGARGAMLIISNLGDEAVSAEVTLDRAALRLPERATARDVLSGETLPWEGGTLRAFLGSLSFRVVRIAP